MIRPEVLDAMLHAGCSAEQIAAAVKAAIAADEGRRAEKRAADAARKRRSRSAVSVVSADVTQCPRDIADTPRPSETRVSPTPPSQTQPPPVRPLKGAHYPPEVVVLDDEGARAAPTQTDADAMVEEIIAAAIPDGHRLRVDVLAASVCIGWIKSGYDLRQDVIPAVRKALSGRYQITGWRSLTAWVANSHADRMAAEQARPPPEIPPPHSASATVTRLRPRNDPVSTIDIGRSVAARPPPGFA